MPITFWPIISHISMSGWLNQKQEQVIDYLVEENRVL